MRKSGRGVTGQGRFYLPFSKRLGKKREIFFQAYDWINSLIINQINRIYSFKYVYIRI